MTKREFIEATASGLRNMNVTPDYLLVIVGRFSEWEWDEPTICGIDIIKGYVSVNSGHSGYDYPILPCFKDLNEHGVDMETYMFQRGFEEKGEHLL